MDDMVHGRESLQEIGVVEDNGKTSMRVLRCICCLKVHLVCMGDDGQIVLTMGPGLSRQVGALLCEADGKEGMAS